MKSLLCAVLFAVVFAAVVSAQSISVGNGNVIYQVLFSRWQNPDGKLFTGSYCNFVAKTCQTRFNGYVDILSSASDKPTDPTWPGPKKLNVWPIIGQSSYKANDLKDFAYLNLTGVEVSKFKAAVLRVKVTDAGYVTSNEINSYYGELPSLTEIGVTKYESDAKFSNPIELEALSSALPSAVTKGYKADRTTVQQQHLFVKVRAWGVDMKRKTAEADVNDAVSSGSGKDEKVYCNRRCRKNKERKQGRSGSN